LFHPQQVDDDPNLALHIFEAWLIDSTTSPVRPLNPAGGWRGGAVAVSFHRSHRLISEGWYTSYMNCTKTIPIHVHGLLYEDCVPFFSQLHHQLSSIIEMNFRYWNTIVHEAKQMVIRCCPATSVTSVFVFPRIPSQSRRSKARNRWTDGNMIKPGQTLGYTESKSKWPS
jgi:hypothetical protein